MRGERAGRGNAQLKRLRLLARDASSRRAERACVIEGRKLVEELLEGSSPIELAVAADSLDAEPELIDRLQRRADLLLRVSDDLLASLADTRSPQGVLLVVPRPDCGLPTAAGGGPLLVGWELQDPGNVGALIRSAAASGCAAACFARGPGGSLADPFSPRSLRSSAGAALRLPTLEWTVEAADLPGRLAALGHRPIALVPRGGALPEALDLGGAAALIVGSEGRGLPPALLAGAELLTLPLAGGVESLGAAAAGAVACFEAARQRRLERALEER